ncbi:hypothetical protein DFH28DRAFT_1218701 [Melampsora americana]|nr:hypothetical protein DFH28DRAFT_1218701 [Melampsora americana]
MKSNQSELNQNHSRPTLSSITTPPPTSSSSSITNQIKSSQNQSLKLNSNQEPNFNKISKTGDPSLAKKRNRNLLRDYYGLSNQIQTKEENQVVEEEEEEKAAIEVKRLMKTFDLNSILSKTNMIFNQIRELDSERQSLVYNHHHELVDASLTIGKMKNSTETLDNTLEEIKTSFSSISELTTSISQSLEPKKPKIQTNESNFSSFKEDHLHCLLPLISLPILLNHLIQNQQKSWSDQLWGEWEIILKSLEDSGIQFIQKISNESREILKQSRKV